MINSDIIEKPIKNHKDFEVKPVRGTAKKIKIIWDDLFPGYKSLRFFLVGKTLAGKSTIIYNLLKHIVSNLTHLIVISESVSTDDVTIKLIERFNKILPKVTVYDKLDINTINKAVHEMTEVVKMYKNQDDDDTPNQNTPHSIFDRFNKILKPVAKTKKKKRVDDDIIFPYNICYIDDVAQRQLRQEYMYSYIKKSRHMGSLLICSQFFNDLNNSSRNQMSHFILMKGITDVKLKQIYEELAGNMSFKEFMELYLYCTSDPYSFMMISNRGEVRKNLNVIVHTK